MALVSRPWAVVLALTLTLVPSALGNSCAFENKTYAFDLDWTGKEGIKKETHDLSLQEFCLKLESVVERSDATREAKVLALPICQGDGDDLCRDMCLEILQAPLIRGPSHSEDKAEQKAQHHFGPNITFGKNVCRNSVDHWRNSLRQWHRVEKTLEHTKLNGVEALKAAAPKRPRGPYGTDAFYMEKDKCTVGAELFKYTAKGMVDMCHSLHNGNNSFDTTHRLLASSNCMHSQGCQEMCIEMLDCPYLLDMEKTKQLPAGIRHKTGEVLGLSESTCGQCAGQYWNTRVKAVGTSWNRPS